MLPKLLSDKTSSQESMGQTTSHGNGEPWMGGLACGSIAVCTGRKLCLWVHRCVHWKQAGLILNHPLIVVTPEWGVGLKGKLMLLSLAEHTINLRTPETEAER